MRRLLGLRLPFRFVVAVAAAAAAGCGSDGPGLEPVRGRVTVHGRPLTTGSVSFRPDPARGNTTLHHPTGAVAADGTYQVFTGEKSRCPPGVVQGPRFCRRRRRTGAAAHPRKPTWLVHEKYTREQATDLSVEVAAGDDPDRYDLRLVK